MVDIRSTIDAGRRGSARNGIEGRNGIIWPSSSSSSFVPVPVMLACVCVCARLNVCAFVNQGEGRRLTLGTVTSDIWKQQGEILTSCVIRVSFTQRAVVISPIQEGQNLQSLIWFAHKSSDKQTQATHAWSINTITGSKCCWAHVIIEAVGSGKKVNIGNIIGIKCIKIRIIRK